jgi:hypothetical protein
VKNSANSSPIGSSQKSRFSDNDWDIDIGQYAKAIVRFFYNGRLNTHPYHLYYDENKNLVLRILFNKNGEEQARDLYKYLNNELVEYKKWFKESGVNQWVRWCHGMVETIEENGNIVTVTKENKYDEDYQIVGKTIKTKDGKLISKEESRMNGDYLMIYSYSEYNENGDAVLSIHKHEESNKMNHETYILEYNDKNNLINKKEFEDGVLFAETTYHYNENNIKILEIVSFCKTIERFFPIPEYNVYQEGYRIEKEYKYGNNKRIETLKYFDKHNEEMISWYYEYDSENRLVLWHEETTDGTNRRNIYEYY